jgi:membrane fusion protein, adhesin transport system
MFGLKDSDDGVAQRLTQPLVLEDGKPPRILAMTLYTFSGFVLAAILWGTVTDVRELTTATGQIIPSGQVQTVQHLEGGIVAEILVREGAKVASGQALIRLEPAATASDRNQLASRSASFRLQLIRLDAETRDELPQFGALGTEQPNLSAEQIKLYASAVSQRRKERATLAARVAQRRSDIAVASSDLATAGRQLAVQQEQFSIQGDLVKQGYTARKTYLDAKTTLQRAEGEAASLEGKLATAREALIEAESTLAQTDAAAELKISEERAKAAADLGETEQQLAKFADRVDRLFVRAPSDGFVQELAPKATGEIIKPGDMVARIVPSGQELVAEVKIEAKDVGHVTIGAPADVRFITYDSTIYGIVAGTVDYISATSFMPAAPGGSPAGQSPSEPYYKAIVRLSQDHVGNGTMKHPIFPGMVVQASIVTGSKSIVRYLLKPVFNSLDVAFTER